MAETKTAKREKVVIYVRLGSPHIEHYQDDDGDHHTFEVESRTLSFPIPDGMDQNLLMEQGFAIDGNSAAKSVEPGVGTGTSIEAYVNGQGEYLTLQDALLEEQTWLRDWLKSLGYDVVFA